MAGRRRDLNANTTRPGDVGRRTARTGPADL